MADIGRRNLLKVTGSSAHGLYLGGGEHGDILLPGKYVPQGAGEGDTLDVFVYLDSEDRLVATTEQPLAMAGESRTHYRIARNLTRALEDQRSNPTCEIVMEAVKVRVHTGRCRYPDVVVTCDPGDGRSVLS